jgi:hypothetical protein
MTPGGALPLHSLYDARKESERLAESHRDAGCLVVLGLGAGHHVSALLRNPGMYAVLVVEEDAGTLRSLFETVDMVDILADARVTLTAGHMDIRHLLPSLWQPALMGNLRTVPLRPWCEVRHEFFSRASVQVQAAVDAARADYSVQAHFGKRWFSNILLNLDRAETADSSVPLLDSVSVTAAGPSLERHLGSLASSGTGGALIASDTSLPALLRSGVRPDVVVSIDCQVYSYHHFLQGLPRTSLLALDLSSPPAIARLSRNVVFLASSHPFVTYLCAHWRRFLPVDMAGGNVTHAAVSLADRLQARRITVYGADFSYPRGKSYCRGTYLYDFFAYGQSRTSPLEAQFAAFLRRSADTRSEQSGGHLRFVTASLSSYSEKLLELMSGAHAEIVPVPGEGLLLPPSHGSGQALADTAPFRASPARCGWRQFLGQYADELRSLPDFSTLSGVAGARRSPEEKHLCATMLPVAARIRKENPDISDGREALSRARDWTLDRITRTVSSETPNHP